MTAASPRSRRGLILALAVAVLSVTAGLDAPPAHTDAVSQTPARSDPAESPSPVDLRSGAIGQRVWRMTLALTTQGAKWAPADLTTWSPGQAPRSHICLLLDQGARHPTLCVVRRQDGGPGLVRPVGDGRWALLRSASVTRSPAERLQISFAWRELGLGPGPLRWRLDSAWTDAPCAEDPAGCRDQLPNGGAAGFRLRRPMPAGCSVPGPSVRYQGPHGRRLVSLTFDDGPGPATSRIVRILRRFEMSATFFQIGRQIGSPKLERMILRSGSEIGGHTYAHDFYPGYGSIAAGSRAIFRASGYRPCLFRPPGGGTSAGVVAAARANGMKTILWSVDPRDWSNPGVGAIISNVLGNARPGAIVVMHDGGGSRAQTVAALPSILRGLRNRGLRSVKVSQLLRGRTRWG